jgi:hypothetical protein
MKRLSAIVLAAALAFGCTACAAPKPSRSSGAIRVAAPRVLSEVELSAALLKVPDLPAGYGLDPEPGEDGQSGGSGGGGQSGGQSGGSGGSDPELDSSGNPACDTIFEEVRGTGSALKVADATTAEIEFTRGDLGPIISQSLYSSGSRPAARAAFDTFRRIPLLCSEFTESDDGGSFSIRLSEAPFAPVGDESYAIRLDATGRGEGADVTLGGYLVLFRSVATTSIIVHVGIPGVDPAETQKIAAAAAARLTPLTKPR